MALADKSQVYDEKVAKHVWKWVSGLQVKMKAQLFDPMDTVSVIGFVSGFKMACENNAMHECAANVAGAILHKVDGSGSTDGRTIAESEIVQEDNEGKQIKDQKSGCESPAGNELD